MHPFKHQRKSFQNRQTPSMSSPHSHTQTESVNQDDEGDICPICESECTCDNKKLPIAPQKHRPLPPLKVKVAVSSSSNPKLSGSNKRIRSKPSTSAPTNPHLPQTGQFSVSDPRLKSHLLDPTIPKRRGRPPKVVVAARAALAAAAANSSPERIAGPSTLPQRPKAKSLKRIAKPHPKSKARGTNLIKPPLARRKRKADESYHPKGLVRRRPLFEDLDDSDDDDEDNLLLEDDDDVEPSAPLDLPTFISASSSSSSESSSLSSLSSSEDAKDMDMESEEEQNIKDSEDEKERRARKDKARVRRELLGENDPRQHGRSHHHHNRWDIKPRRRSVSASDGEADVDMGAESGDTTETDDEDQDAVAADDEDEPDAIGVDRDGRRKLGVSFAGVVTGWSDGEDSNYDADLFFANLDSSGSDTGSNAAAEMSSMDADGEDGEQDSADEIAEAMTLAAAAGLYDGWEGPIVFAARDVDVEMDLSPSPKLSRRRRMSSSILTTDDEHIGRRVTDPTVGGGDVRLEEDNEIDLAESDGETTQEELIGADGRPNARAMMLFKWPVSVGAVDPMNTLTPGRRGNGSAPRHSMPQREPEELDDSSDKALGGIKTLNGRRTGVPHTPRGPVAGTFQLTPQSVEPVKTAVITGHQPALPSPYPRSRRLFSSGERIGHGSIRDRSLSVSGQSSVQTEGSSVPSQHTDPDIFTMESMDLDDVLEAAFLASDSSRSDAELSSHAEQGGDRTDAGEMSSRSHVEDLRRWERIPMTAFRRTRESQGSISNDDGTPWSAKSGDGTDFYAVAMMHNNLQHLLSSPTPASSQKQPVGRTGSGALSSPISLGGSESGGRVLRSLRTITRDHKSEKERKEEKKALRKMAHTKPSLGRAFISNHQAHHHHRHQHHPNTKSRASGSMQRTNFFNSSLTPGNP